MTIFLVRHAKAGSRAKWQGEDSLRPLSRSGRAQADALADWLGAEVEGAAPTSGKQRPRLVSSPSMRCVQTIEPLAARVGEHVETDERLAEGAWFDRALSLLDELPDGSVLCSHGDVIPDVVVALERRGMRVEGEPDWRKAATWLLQRDGDGAYVGARAVPPPTIE